KAANAQRRHRASDPDGNHVLRRGRGSGQRREAAFLLHRESEALILGGALRLDFGKGKVREVARPGRAAVAREILRLERRVARLGGAATPAQSRAAVASAAVAWRLSAVAFRWRRAWSICPANKQTTPTVSLPVASGSWVASCLAASGSCATALWSRPAQSLPGIG